MVGKARIWLDGDLPWASDEGGVAVRTQTTLLLTLCAGESLPLEDEDDEEPEPLPPAPVPKSPEKPKRHLAGANWLDDWTMYLPDSSKKPKRKSPPNLEDGR